MAAGAAAALLAPCAVAAITAPRSFRVGRALRLLFRVRPMHRVPLSPRSIAMQCQYNLTIVFDKA